jgi:hypothetical protein
MSHHPLCSGPRLPPANPVRPALSACPPTEPGHSNRTLALASATASAEMRRCAPAVLAATVSRDGCPSSVHLRVGLTHESADTDGCTANDPSAALETALTGRVGKRIPGLRQQTPPPRHTRR